MFSRMPIHKIVLPNGLRLLCVPRKDSLATTVMLLVRAGSEYETVDNRGISHFLEHMYFKGTKKRPKPIDIAEELDGLGAEYNAFTSREITSFYVKTRKSDWSVGLDVLADAYKNSLFDKGELEKEKGVIIEELNMYEDQPSEKVGEVWNELMYGDTPAGWSIIGTRESIKKMSAEKLRQYEKARYLASETVVVVAGSFEVGKVQASVEEYFGKLQNNTAPEKAEFREAPAGLKETLIKKNSDQTHLVLGFKGWSLFDKRRYVISVLNGVLGGSMSSRLFQRIRENMGAAYYIGSSYSQYTDHGHLTVHAGVMTEKITEVVAAISEECKHLKDHRIQAKELERAKRNIIGHLFLSLEQSDEIGYFYGKQEVLGLEKRDPVWISEQIQKVTGDELLEVANELFLPEAAVITAVSPSEASLVSYIQL